MSYAKQHVRITNDRLQVDLSFFSHELFQELEKDLTSSPAILELQDPNIFQSSSLKVDITTDTSVKTCVITGIHGSTFLHSIEKDKKSQTVKIEDDNIIVSAGIHFFSLNLQTLSFNWKLEPDMAEVFEFYDFQGDYLLRGEVQIHRIDKNGNIKWSYGGKDIWVNMEGKSEVTIEENRIRLIDFNSDAYLIDFDGKTIQS